MESPRPRFLRGWMRRWTPGTTAEDDGARDDRGGGGEGGGRRGGLGVGGAPQFPERSQGAASEPLSFFGFSESSADTFFFCLF